MDGQPDKFAQRASGSAERGIGGPQQKAPNKSNKIKKRFIKHHINNTLPSNGCSTLFGEMPARTPKPIFSRPKSPKIERVKLKNILAASWRLFWTRTERSHGSRDVYYKRSTRRFRGLATLLSPTTAPATAKERPSTRV